MMSSRLWGKITVLVAVCGWPLSAQAKYSGGSGTEAEPYRISAVFDWQELMTTPADWASHFVLTGGLDLDGVLLSPVGSDNNKFIGVLDGNDYVIRNADVNVPLMDYVGLLGCLGTDGQIKNLGMEDTSVIGRYWVGGLVGWNYQGAISNCYSTGTVSGDENVGGLVGYNCLSSGTIINSYSTGSVAGDRYVGGLVGTNGGTVSNCYSTGTVSGNYFVGGMVGWNYQGAIINSYSTGSVGGAGASVGGLVGSKYAGVVSSSFWDVNTSGWTTSDGGTPETTVEMKTQSTFTSAGWDFIGETANGTEDIWRMCVDGVEYPQLTWEYVQVGDFACPDGVDGRDLRVLCGDWLSIYSQVFYGADANGDNHVTFADFVIMAQRWLSGL